MNADSSASPSSDVMVREYADGVLVREDGISVEQLDAIFGPLKSFHKKTRITRKPKSKVGELCYGEYKEIMEQLGTHASRILLDILMSIRSNIFYSSIDDII